MGDLPKHHANADSMHVSYLKPLSLTPQPPISRFKTIATSASNGPARHSWTMTTRIRELAAIEERSSSASAVTLMRTNSDDSLRVPDDYRATGSENSDDSGPILPIQRQEVQFPRETFYVNGARSQSLADEKYSSFSRPGNR